MREFILSDCVAVIRTEQTVNFLPVYLGKDSDLFVREKNDYVPVLGFERIEIAVPKNRGMKDD